MYSNRSKCIFFKTRIKCKLNGKDIEFCSDENIKRVFLSRFGTNGSIYYRFCASKMVHDYICFCAGEWDTILQPKSVIENLIITFESYYFIMTSIHRLQQPKSILECNLLKHIHNTFVEEKNNNYNFLAYIYDLNKDDYVDVSDDE